MYARVTSFQVQPGKMDELTQIANEAVLPVVQQQQGFKSYVALQDRNNDKAMLITLFDSEADARAGASSGGFVQQQTAKIASLITGTPTVEFYEVTSQG